MVRKTVVLLFVFGLGCRSTGPAVRADCPLSAAELPTSSLYAADDPRWLRGKVVVVLKSARRIMVFDRGQLVDGSCRRMALGRFYPDGPKRVEGDRKTPQGWYRTSDKPTSSYYGAIWVHYPNEADVQAGVEAGTISDRLARRILRALRSGERPPQSTPMGGQILIHGGGSAYDWTLGCIAMENLDLDHLRSLLPGGMRAHLLILP